MASVGDYPASDYHRPGSKRPVTRSSACGATGSRIVLEMVFVYFLYLVPYTTYLTSNASTIQNEKGLLETSFHVSFAYGKELLLMLVLMCLEVGRTSAA